MGSTHPIIHLSASDVSNLRLESRSAPFHIGGLAILEAAPLLDGSGRLRLAEIRARLEHRIAAVPQLRRRLRSPGVLGGRPIWVDEAGFDISRHVFEAQIAAPGGEGELLETVAELFGQLLDRGHPLWELWFLTGLTGGRIAVLLKLHHAVADGMAALAIMRSLLDAGTAEVAPVPWRVEPPPPAWALRRDNLAGRVRGIREACRALGHPTRVLHGAAPW